MLADSRSGSTPNGVGPLVLSSETFQPQNGVAWRPSHAATLNCGGAGRDLPPVRPGPLPIGGIMLSRLLPRSHSFFDFFEKHAALIVQAAQELARLGEKDSDPKEIAGRVKAPERQADEVTHECMATLHRTLITPIDRNHIHALATGLDDIIDAINESSRTIALFEIARLRDGSCQAAAVALEATRAVELAVKGLRNVRNSNAIMKEC